MTIRKMTRADAAAASQTCQRAFMQKVAPTVTPEGINTFLDVTAKKSLQDLCQTPEYDVYVYEEAQQILGVVALREKSHLSLLFVAPEQQGRGIGQQLFNYILTLCESSSITVKSSLPSVSFYRQFGFAISGPEAIESGLAFQPMERLVAAK